MLQACECSIGLLQIFEWRRWRIGQAFCWAECEPGYISRLDPYSVLPPARGRVRRSIDIFSPFRRASSEPRLFLTALQYTVSHCSLHEPTQTIKMGGANREGKKIVLDERSALAIYPATIWLTLFFRDQAARSSP